MFQFGCTSDRALKNAAIIAEDFYNCLAPQEVQTDKDGGNHCSQHKKVLHPADVLIGKISDYCDNDGYY